MRYFFGNFPLFFFGNFPRCLFGNSVRSVILAHVRVPDRCHQQEPQHVHGEKPPRNAPDSELPHERDHDCREQRRIDHVNNQLEAFVNEPQHHDHHRSRDEVEHLARVRDQEIDRRLAVDVRVHPLDENVRHQHAARRENHRHRQRRHRHNREKLRGEFALVPRQVADNDAVQRRREHRDDLPDQRGDVENGDRLSVHEHVQEQLVRLKHERVDEVRGNQKHDGFHVRAELGTDLKRLPSLEYRTADRHKSDSEQLAQDYRRDPGQSVAENAALDHERSNHVANRDQQVVHEKQYEIDVQPVFDVAVVPQHAQERQRDEQRVEDDSLFA